VTPLFPTRNSVPGEIERVLCKQGFSVLAGVDEAGRGALFGPVVAAAVILPFRVFPPGLDDSKKLKPARREVMAAVVKEAAVAWAVGVATAAEIDEINILQATFLAMRRALSTLVNSGPAKPELVLVDGPHAIAELKLPQKPVVKGDSRSANIAAASIIAKTARDRCIVELHDRFPLYGLAAHKGYGTKAHISAIREHGLTPLHRKSFCKRVRISTP